MTSYVEAEKIKSRLSKVEELVDQRIQHKRKVIMEEHLKDLRFLQKRQLNQLQGRVEAKRGELRRDREKVLQR